MDTPTPWENALAALRRGEYEEAFPAFRAYPVDTMSCAWNVTLAHSRNDPPQCREQARWLHWAGGCAKRGISFPEDSACALCWAALKHEPGSAERMLQLRLAAANEDVVEVVTTPLERADKAARALAAYELSLEAGSEAADWLERAAKGGDDCAQNDLGDRYAKGKHVVRDDAAAARWFRQAAEQGNDTAQTNLGSLYFLGRACPGTMRKRQHGFGAQLNSTMTLRNDLGPLRDIPEPEHTTCRSP